jgi:hypothetical protein
MTHISGPDRSQTLLLPESLDEYVGQDNPVRLIDAFVEELDLTAAGFIRVVVVARPASGSGRRALTFPTRPRRSSRPPPTMTARAIITPRRRGRFGDAPDLTPVEHQRRGDAADAVFREPVRRATVHAPRTNGRRRRTRRPFSAAQPVQPRQAARRRARQNNRRTP